MKKLLMIVSALAALSLLAPSSSYAQAENGYMGLYLDDNDPLTDGASCLYDVAFLQHKTAYIVYLNPIIPSTRGFECGIDLTTPAKDAQINTSLTVTYPIAATDVGTSNASAGTYNYITGFSVPVVISGSSFIFATLDIFFLEASQLNFTLRAAIPASLGSTTPVVMREDFSLFSVALAQAEGSPNLIINPTSGDCTGVTLPTEDISWGAVKSLYR